ncbi:hypothetical protein K491DRAFT_383441 [Lophiostoma macrostomum CBS 122681]|uniref:Uncharacterized protein n=1 Tax=Lophiostoma macrostomum CBS 122681 TaxID=1314788 RepID=A0A6A6TNS0_9PLEO|nr:hypothetical protein K491DRAFT_383441 [Lophiostoma macrostomum CBS 122681]
MVIYWILRDPQQTPSSSVLFIHVLLSIFDRVWSGDGSSLGVRNIDEWFRSLQSTTKGYFFPSEVTWGAAIALYCQTLLELLETIGWDENCMPCPIEVPQHWMNRNGYIHI